MKSTDLMIGDLVTFKDCQNDNPPMLVSIFEINGNNDAFASIDNDQILDMISLEEVVGIPLTPEILEKNGFVTKDFFSELVDSKYRILSDAKHIAIIHGDHTDLDIPICFVHELQHCLKLCGIEKKIVL